MSDVDLLDPALHASGAVDAELARLTREAPVAWREGRRGPGYWAVTGHAEVSAAARDPSTFSSYWGTRPEVLRSADARRPLHNLDPPAHGPLRAVAVNTLTGARLDALEPTFAGIVDSTLAAAATTCDAVAALAEPITLAAFAAWLEVEPATVRSLRDRVTAVHVAGAALLDTAHGDPARPARVEEARAASSAIAEAVAALPSAPLRALGAEAVPLGILLVEAGLPTLADAIGSAIVDLAVHPPPAAPAALLVEELLRRASPIAQFARRARVDTELGGQRIRAGEQVVLWFAAANRDPRVFPEPEALVADRTPNPHHAFGVGPHRCIGAAFARRVLRLVVPAILAAAPELTGPPVRRASSYQRGFTHAPIRIGRATSQS